MSNYNETDIERLENALHLAKEQLIWSISLIEKLNKNCYKCTHYMEKTGMCDLCLVIIPDDVRKIGCNKFDLDDIPF